MALLSNYPKLSKVVETLDAFLRQKHPDFFGDTPIRPFAPLKPSKVIHDAIWGTFSFSWKELAVLDTPLVQRLRDIHQVGLAYLIYDIDMYLYSAQVDIDVTADGDNVLQRLYASVAAANAERHAASPLCEYPYFETYRLCLPKRAMHVLEQIVICKMMLFSYVYNHPKVRAAEGLLERILDRRVKALREAGGDDWDILEWFLESTDADLIRWSDEDGDEMFKEGAYRLVNRLLPREVYRLAYLAFAPFNGFPGPP